MSVPATLTQTEAFHPLVSHLALLSLPLYPIDIIWEGRREGPEGPEGICGEIHCGGSEGDKLLAEGGRERKRRLIRPSLHHVRSSFWLFLTIHRHIDDEKHD